jgi:hypothetical protein
MKTAQNTYEKEEILHWVRDGFRMMGEYGTINFWY